MTCIAATVQAFFTERLTRQRRASPHTVAAYRDTLRLLLVYAAQRRNTPPGRLDIAEVDAPTITAFLDHLEHERGNSIRTRNARLAAIHSLFSFAALRHPEHAEDINRILAIPAKRTDHTIITFLTDAEVEAILASPDLGTRTGRRDHTMILLAV
jgi:site-specific recombinase XerD